MLYWLQSLAALLEKLDFSAMTQDEIEDICICKCRLLVCVRLRDWLVLIHFCRWLPVADSWNAMAWHLSFYLFVPWLRKTPVVENRWSVCHAWLMSRGSTSGCREVMRGKPGVASVSSAAGHWAGKTQYVGVSLLTYAASGSVAVCLKTDRRLLSQSFDIVNWMTEKASDL